MLTISILSLFPQTIEPFIKESIIKRATEKNLVNFNLFNLRLFTHDKRQTVDDRPMGGGAGMLLKIEPLVEGIESIEKQFGKAYKILLTPSGNFWNQNKANNIINKLNVNNSLHLLLICGHYEGFDDRILNFIDEEISIGQYILSSGEAAAIIIIDTLTRLIPGVLKKEEATLDESFKQIKSSELKKIIPEINKEEVPDEISLLEYPQYTLPRNFRELKIPDILLSGDHKKIQSWQLKQAFEKTKKRNKK